ncbi:MAG TPA: tRNA (guanosine(37)-N1)-methyltransferase TrmD [Acidobacteriota bacterium]|nr:tRNA (guanosine(37)-N1)-methyltransferase TrmD [Acidobacteriota bacterium]
MKIDVLTIFPAMLETVFRFGMIRRARELGKVEIRVWDLREFAEDRHGTVDDRPYGGGPGMVMKPEPLFRAVEDCRRKDATPGPVLLMSPQGRRFDQEAAKRLSLEERLIILCGRYEGVDQRVVDHLVNEEVSIGDYVLSGGELPAAVVVDAVVRLVPGVLGEGESALQDSFVDGLLDHPHYTRPAEFRGWEVPAVLLSGDHKAIRRWREEQALALTRSRRPDLLKTSE